MSHWSALTERLVYATSFRMQDYPAQVYDIRLLLAGTSFLKAPNSLCRAGLQINDNSVYSNAPNG